MTQQSAYGEGLRTNAPEPPRPAHPRGAQLSQLASLLGVSETLAADPVITGITLDSRTAQRGDLLAALPGAHTHGARFAAQAAERGAVAALTDADGAAACRKAGLIVLEVRNPRADTARAADAIYGSAWRRVKTIAVTGTNGKTSVTTMVRSALGHLGHSAGMIGTGGTLYCDDEGREHRVATARTTPEATDLHGIFARMVEDGVDVCAMEVSSHALVLHRADQAVFDVACFTNLSQDHLDFHPTMEDYFQAKARLFTPEHSRRGIVCVDDEWGRRLAATASVPVTTYATAPGVDADVTATDIRSDGFGTCFTARSAAGDLPLRAALPGRHYVANTLAAHLLLDAIGVRGPEVDKALGIAGTVPGRMELIVSEPVRGVVDYSHTPAALEQALETLRAVPGTERLITVMGAGGDRDRTKRPLMGKVAADGSEIVIITDDNPRTEDPAAIRDQVRSGIPAERPDVHMVDGRAAAITLAARLANVGDTILVAGKGAETGQEIGGIVHPFDDRVQLRDALGRRNENPRTTMDGDH